ncbi:MAG: RNA polymerase sigma factor [Planctomycetales bacterium]|nr:RNA polymerase sigma factor [Planctomycetales bacterium]
MPDVPSIEELWFEHGERIRRAALMLCGNAWDADDLVQETFATIADSPRAFQGRSAVYTWMYGILLNLDRRRRRRASTHQRKVATLQEQPPATPGEAGPDAQAIAAEWKETLWSRVHELPERQRQTLVLRYSEDLKYEEIAEVLECPVGTVKSRIYHGLLALRRLLGEDSEHSPATDHQHHS